MTLFATPDFGASACLGGILVISWGILILLAVVGVASGARLFGSESSCRKKLGIFLITVSIVIPLACCLAPSHIVRITHGNYPIGRYPSGKITEGMTAEEVETVLGPPHEKYDRGDGEHWIYWIDSFSLSWFGVRFDADGRVISTHGN